MTAQALQHGASEVRSHDDQVLATIIFVPCFFMLLAADAVARLRPRALRSSKVRSGGSLIQRARTAAYDCVAFALMG